MQMDSSKFMKVIRKYQTWIRFEVSNLGSPFSRAIGNQVGPGLSHAIAAAFLLRLKDP